MYMDPMYNKLISEHFDIEDRDTRKILLNINEDDQVNVLTSLTSKLYENIVEKVDDIDFGEVPLTKGDITKLSNYEKLVESLDLIEGIIVEFKQDVSPVNTIKEAIANIKDNREIFEKAFRYNIELPISYYCSIVLAIVASISLLISSCIEFIKTPSEEQFSVTVDRVGLNRTSQHLLFTNLKKFNSSCDDGDFQKAMNLVIDPKVKNFVGAPIGIIAGIGGVAVLLNIIPILRELIFFFYFSKTKVADYFEIQADLLYMNAYNLESNSSKDKKEIERITKKQYKIVDNFRKISNFFAIKAKEGEVKATKEIVKTDKKYKTDEVLDSMPDSAASSLF